MTKVPSSRLERDPSPPRRPRSEAAEPRARAPEPVKEKALPRNKAEGAAKAAAVSDGLLEAIDDGAAEVTQPAGLALPAQKAQRSDKFERATAAGLAKLQQLEPQQKQPPLKPRAAPGTALSALNEAKPPGVYFREDENSPDAAAAEDPELEAAVEEAIRLLFGVAGIHHIGPGKNELGEPVVVIACARGFSESSLARVPESVHRFPTLLAIPFELLPLRRI